MRKRNLLLGAVLLLLYTACTLPIDFLLESENEDPEGTTIKEEIQELIDFVEGATPTPVVLPADQLASADEALFAGEIGKARDEYQEAFTNSSED